MSPMRQYLPMKRRRPNPTEEEWERAVYKAVSHRSGGRCEVNLLPTEERTLEPQNSFRCKLQARDKHHTVKPRRSNTSVDTVVDICRQHHDRVDWPYKRGRLIIVPLGEQQFRFDIKWASDKWAARRLEER